MRIMGKPLFHNVGESLKELAENIANYIKFTYGLVAVAVLIGGIALSALSENAFGAILGIIVAIIIFAVGYNKARLQVITLYAYGELVDRVMAIEGNMSGTNRSSGKGKKKVVPVAPKTDLPITEKGSDGSWTCVFCDHVNRPGADWCEECGTEARFE